MLRPVIVISVLLGGTAALAGPVPLTNDDLKRTVSGSLVEIDTPLGAKIPVRFGTDGLVSAEAGELAPLLGSAKDRGRWRVDGDKLCFKWFRWFDAQERCLTIRQDGTRIFWRKDDGETGTATLVEQGTPKVAPPQQASKPAETVAEARVAPAKKEVVKEKPAKPAAAEPTAKPQEIAAASVADIPAPPVAEAPVAPIVVAEAAPQTPAVAPDDHYDVPMMRFGGAGLLEASNRISPVQATAPSAEAAPAGPPPQTTDGVSSSDVETGALMAALSPLRHGATSPQAPPQQPQQQRSATPPTPPQVAKPAAVAPPAAQGETPSAAMQAQAPSPSTSRGVPAMSPPSVSTSRTTRLYRVRGVERFDVLNVRRGPAETYAAVGVIPSKGRDVEITGLCQGDWCPVRYGRVAGWVHSFYLAEERPRRGSGSRVYFARP